MKNVSFSHSLAQSSGGLRVGGTRGKTEKGALWWCNHTQCSCCWGPLKAEYLLITVAVGVP